MTEPSISDYFDEGASTEDERRRYAQNSLIIDTAVAINRALEVAEISQRELATRLGKSEGFVSQVLSGGGNLTLRTLADFAYGIDCIVQVVLQPKALAAASLGTKCQTSWISTAIEDVPRTVNTQLALAA